MVEPTLECDGNCGKIQNHPPITHDSPTDHPPITHRSPTIHPRFRQKLMVKSTLECAKKNHPPITHVSPTFQAKTNGDLNSEAFKIFARNVGDRWVNRGWSVGCFFFQTTKWLYSVSFKWVKIASKLGDNWVKKEVNAVDEFPRIQSNYLHKSGRRFLRTPTKIVGSPPTYPTSRAILTNTIHGAPLGRH
jgi:hypothetical protein